MNKKISILANVEVIVKKRLASRDCVLSGICDTLATYNGLAELVLLVLIRASQNEQPLRDYDSFDKF